jgi:hypothetical protein
VFVLDKLSRKFAAMVAHSVLTGSLYEGHFGVREFEFWAALSPATNVKDQFKGYFSHQNHTYQHVCVIRGCQTCRKIVRYFLLWAADNICSTCPIRALISGFLSATSERS